MRTPARSSDAELRGREAAVISIKAPHTPPFGRHADAGLLARVVRVAASASARRPKTTVAFWFALIAACVALGTLSGMRTLSNSGSGTG